MSLFFDVIGTACVGAFTLALCYPFVEVSFRITEGWWMAESKKDFFFGWGVMALVGAVFGIVAGFLGHMGLPR